MAVTTRSLYAMAATLGLLERNSKDDAFHQLVYGITGKEHVSELTSAEANEVAEELQKRMHDVPYKKKKKSSKKDVPGMMTEGQQKLAWRLVYRLNELEPTEAAVPERLAGAVEKILGITAPKKDPLRWIKFADGAKLIETLKRYVRSAERRVNKKVGDG